MINIYGRNELNIPSKRLSLAWAIGSLIVVLILLKMQFGTFRWDLFIPMLVASTFAGFSSSRVSRHRHMTQALKDIRELIELRDRNIVFYYWYDQFQRRAIDGAGYLHHLPSVPLASIKVNRSTLNDQTLVRQIAYVLSEWHYSRIGRSS